MDNVTSADRYLQIMPHIPLLNSFVHDAADGAFIHSLIPTHLHDNQMKRLGCFWEVYGFKLGGLKHH